MAKLTFYPLGNADCCLIDLDSDKKFLFDYADARDPEDEDDLRIDLPAKLREDLDAAGRDAYDVVAFSHLDKDHYQGASEFFYLQHDMDYQDDDRIKIETLWVPAALVTEDDVDDDEGKIIQAEAHHRLKQKEGIRVFSRPDRLKDWLEKNGMKLKDIKGLVTDAGQLAPEFSLDDDGVEFFVHSPFAKRLDEDTVEDRNAESLVLHATFLCDGTETKVFLAADAIHDVLADIVDITKSKKNEARLDWDVFKLPHHCSYLSLGPKKGTDKTVPVDQVESLYEEHGQAAGVIVSTSKPIPEKGSEEDKDDNPPHRQAANYYKDVRDMHEGEFIVTMEHHKPSEPVPLEIEIDESKATVLKRALAASTVATTRRAPRAG